LPEHFIENWKLIVATKTKSTALKAQPATAENVKHESAFTSALQLQSQILARLKFDIGKDPEVAKSHDWLQASILAIRDRVIGAWMESTRKTYDEKGKRVYYLSLEFLIGRLLRDAVSNLGLMDELREALAGLEVNLDAIAALEPDAALGNGGLGRLAACFMESMATVDIPAFGYGIRYVHGLFRQQIADGWQIEFPETWLNHGNPWEFERQESAYEIGFGGAVDMVGEDKDGMARCVWRPLDKVIATAFDTPIVGWKANRVNTLRLWSASPVDPIRLDAFNAGDHIGALHDSTRAETLTRVLYPADATPAGQELRLRQEYFFSSASLQDILRRHLMQFGDLRTLPDKVAIQLNDTHPAISVAELMRLLVDIHRIDFGLAWDLTRATFGYTNHTLLPEALESWPVHLMERMLPRHMQLIYAINGKVLREARKEKDFNDEQIRSISLIDEGGERRVRMGNLAFVGSHSINGVSALHTDLMKKTVFSDLHALYPNRINNKTNGITPRRWLMQCNPGLTSLLRETIGDKFMDNADALKALEPFAKDKSFQKAFMAIKHDNKIRLAQLVQRRLGLKIDPNALFDVQIKRIHEYKRQLLNVLHTVVLYDEMRAHPEKDWAPRVKIFAGKAASSYHNAKLIIKLANDVARTVNSDPAVRGLLKVAFIPNYNVSLAEVIIPAADLSEQISTAGMEASGTGNMKFAMNGALTIGTLDGANVEMKEHIGDDNIIIFGMTTDQVDKARRDGHNPRQIIEKTALLRQALSSIGSGVFSPEEPGRYAGMVAGLNDHDWFMVAADYADYHRAQCDVEAIWHKPSLWAEKAILNTARTGWFSSDRTIREYARDIWGVKALES
jgi:glycogen phosphorylase